MAQTLFRVRPASSGGGPGAFTAITTASSEHGPNEYASFGFMFGSGALPAANKDKLALRYPVGASGTVYPVQTNASVTRGDGSTNIVKATLSVKMPASYIPGSDFEIGVDGTVSRPSAPTWDLTGAQFRLLVSQITPCVRGVILSGTPAVGDVVSVTVNGSTFNKTVTAPVISQAQWFRDLCDDINDASATTGARTYKWGSRSHVSYAAVGMDRQHMTAGYTTATAGPFPGSFLMLVFSNPVPSGTSTPATFSVTASVTPQAGSTLGVSVVNYVNPAARVAYVANWQGVGNVAHEVISGTNRWHDGFNTREEVFVVPLKRVSDGVEHPDLKVLMGARKNRDGGYDYHWCKVLNCDMIATTTTWHWYDADIEVGGTIVKSFPDLQHDQWQTWLWHTPWKVTLPARTYYETHRFVPRFRNSSVPETTANLDAIRNSARGVMPAGVDISIADLNMPLYQGSIERSTEPGQDPRKGHTSVWEVAAIRMWTFNGWKAFEAYPENMQGAYQIHMRHGVNHINWYADSNTPTPGSSSFPNDYTYAAEYHGGIAPVRAAGTNGLRGWRRHWYQMADTHAPSLSQYLHMLKGEYADLDHNISVMTWMILYSTPSSSAFNMRYPVSGFTHRIGHTTANGIRNTCWDSRSRWIAKLNCPDGSPYRAYLTRIAADSANAIYKHQFSNNLRMMMDQVGLGQDPQSNSYGHRSSYYMTGPFGSNSSHGVPYDARVNSGTWMMNYLLGQVIRACSCGETSAFQQVLDNGATWLQGPYELKYLSQVPGTPLGGAVRHWSAWAVIYGGIFADAHVSGTTPGPFNNWQECLTEYFARPAGTTWTAPGQPTYAPYINNTNTDLASVLANSDSTGGHNFIAMYNHTLWGASKLATDATLRARCAEILTDMQTEFAPNIPGWNTYPFDTDPNAP